MANLGKKGDIYVARFRYADREYKKSLRTTRKADAEAAMHAVERAIHGLATGLIQVPPGVDPGDFIVSGGTLREARKARVRVRIPSFSALIEAYLAGQVHKAPSTVYTERVHLRNLKKGLGGKADAPADRLAHRDLEQYIQRRLGERTPTTVDKERTTIIQLFGWAVAHEFLSESPAKALVPIKGEVELPPFRTVAEIEAMVARGGLDPGESLRAWDCLYLDPGEIAELLQTVRERADTNFAFLLHAIPAYTGMRRGEVLRLGWSDVEFGQKYIIARSRKQSRKRVETTRRIDLHPELERELLAWRERRPSGRYVICEPDDTSDGARSFL